MINPAILTDNELTRFADDILHRTGSLPPEWVAELLKRLNKHTNAI